MIARVGWTGTRAEEGDGDGLRRAYHSKSLYMMVKKTCRNRLTALINTANRKSHASPDIMTCFGAVANDSQVVCEGGRAGGVAAGSCGEARPQALDAAHDRDEGGVGRVEARESERVGQARSGESSAALSCRARTRCTFASG